MAKIKSKLKHGKSKFFKLSMWLGSMVEPKKLLGKCLLDWDDTRANGGRVKIVYKHMQVLQIAKNIILAGVPTDVDAVCITKILWQTMEEAQKKMVAKNPAKYGTLSATPKFSMALEFVKNTPYEAQYEEDKIPFWSKMPRHLEYRTTDKAAIDVLLSYMCNSGRMECIQGGAAFHRKNFPDADFNQRNVNAAILTWHVAMVCSMGRVSLRGLMDPDRPVMLQQFDEEETNKVEMEVSKSVCNIMTTECKAARSRVWCLITHNRENKWVGYYKMGVGNDLHKEFTICWAGRLSAHLRYFLLQCRIDDTGVTKLIKKSFDYNAIIDAANAVEQDGRVISKVQAAAEQKIANFDQKNTWVDVRLGCTPAQQLRYEQSIAAQAMSGGQFNYN